MHDVTGPPGQSSRNPGSKYQLTRPLTSRVGWTAPGVEGWVYRPPSSGDAPGPQTIPVHRAQALYQCTWPRAV